MYSDTLAALSAERTLFQHIAMLQKIRDQTEDEILGTHLRLTIRFLQIEQGKATAQQRTMHFPLRSSFREEIQTLAAYCQSRVESGVPEWQVIARREGWKPPADES